MADSGQPHSFKKGDRVEVWSNTKKTWFVGQITELGHDGSVHAKFGRCLEKWVRPADATAVLRRHVPHEVLPDPLAPPTCVIQAVKGRFRQPVKGAGGIGDPMATDPGGARRAAAAVAGNGGAADTAAPDELSRIWRASLEWQGGRPLSAQEDAWADQCSSQISRAAGLDAEGRVSVDAWLHAALCLVHSPGVSARAAIEAKLAKTRGALSRAMALWEPLDEYGTGFVSRDRLTEALVSTGLHAAAAAEHAKAMTRSLDGDGYGFVSYSEFVASFLGLTYSEVCLYWYDLSNNWAKYLSPVLLWCQEGGIWHTGVVAFGREWYYGGRIFRGEVANTPFGQPDKIQRMGITVRTKRELEKHILQKLDVRYTEAAYDVLEHNCNNFSDEAMVFLLDQQIPEEIRLQPQRAMASPMAKMFRPLLNRLLGRIEGDAAVGDGGADEARRPEGAKPMQSVMDTAKELLGDSNAWLHWADGPDKPPVQAQVVCTHRDGTKDLCWFDRTTGKSGEAKRVRPEVLRPVGPARGRPPEDRRGRSSSSTAGPPPGGQGYPPQKQAPAQDGDCSLM